MQPPLCWVNTGLSSHVVCKWNLEASEPPLHNAAKLMEHRTTLNQNLPAQDMGGLQRLVRRLVTVGTLCPTKVFLIGLPFSKVCMPIKSWDNVIMAVLSASLG